LSLDLQHHFHERRLSFAERDSEGCVHDGDGFGFSVGVTKPPGPEVGRLTQGDKRVLPPSSHTSEFCDQYPSDETKLGVIGQLGVNGPHYALAAKRFCPVRLNTAAHFLVSAHPVSSLLFSPHNDQPQRHKHRTQNTLSDDLPLDRFKSSRQHTTNKSNRSE